MAIVIVNGLEVIRIDDGDAGFLGAAVFEVIIDHAIHHVAVE